MVVADEGALKVVDKCVELEVVELAAAEGDADEVLIAELVVVKLAFRGWKMSFCAPSNHPQDE